MNKDAKSTRRRFLTNTSKTLACATILQPVMSDAVRGNGEFWGFNNARINPFSCVTGTQLPETNPPVYGNYIASGSIKFRCIGSGENFTNAAIVFQTRILVDGNLSGAVVATNLPACHPVSGTQRVEIPMDSACHYFELNGAAVNVKYQGKEQNEADWHLLKEKTFHFWG